MDHYDIKSSVTSFHGYNQKKKTSGIIDRLIRGENIAIISDAGTPGISDPAYFLVSKALEKEIRIEAIPGAAAFLTALVISGLPTNRFVYEGFLPVKKGRKTKLQKLVDEDRTIILYESPHRLLRTLNDLYTFLGNRKIVIARELTKKFEEIVRTTLKDAIVEFDKRDRIKGEFVLLIGHVV